VVQDVIERLVLELLSRRQAGHFHLDPVAGPLAQELRRSNRDHDALVCDRKSQCCHTNRPFPRVGIRPLVAL
jgi:hypothetical protein